MKIRGITLVTKGILGRVKSLALATKGILDLVAVRVRRGHTSPYKIPLKQVF